MGGRHHPTWGYCVYFRVGFDFLFIAYKGQKKLTLLSGNYFRFFHARFGFIKKKHFDADEE